MANNKLAMGLTFYPPPQPDNQENNPDDEQYPEDGACQEV
jgi:hypothetical protein